MSSFIIILFPIYKILFKYIYVTFKHTSLHIYSFSCKLFTPFEYYRNLLPGNTLERTLLNKPKQLASVDYSILSRHWIVFITLTVAFVLTERIDLYVSCKVLVKHCITFVCQPPPPQLQINFDSFFSLCVCLCIRVCVLFTKVSYFEI